MYNEIKEILDRLERIDHKEYSGGFEFADSGSFDEDCRCFEERKKLANYITNLQQELQRKDNIIKDIKDYVNYLVIFNQTINGKFNETQWGQDILGLIDELEEK